MNRQVHPPVILAFPSAARNSTAHSPSGSRSRLERMHRLRCVSDRVTDDVTDDALAKMRARLLRMIIENERVRTDGPRAS
jgi:hypothetical protein